MTKKMSDIINERRDMTTRKFGNGRTLWTRLNHDKGAMAIWNGWVLMADNPDEMFRRAKIAFAEECETHGYVSGFA